MKTRNEQTKKIKFNFDNKVYYSYYNFLIKLMHKYNIKQTNQLNLINYYNLKKINNEQTEIKIYDDKIDDVQTEFKIYTNKKDSNVFTPKQTELKIYNYDQYEYEQKYKNNFCIDEFNEYLNNSLFLNKYELLLNKYNTMVRTREAQQLDIIKLHSNFNFNFNFKLIKFYIDIKFAYNRPPKTIKYI